MRMLSHPPYHVIVLYIYIGTAAAGGSSTPEDVTLPSCSIALRVRFASKSGEECIDLTSLPSSTTMFELVQQLVYMRKKGESEWSAIPNTTNHHKTIVIGPEEWKHTYSFEYDFHVYKTNTKNGNR